MAFEITSSTDNLTGTANNDVFEVKGPVTDLSSADTIDGGGGSDVLVFWKAGTITDAQFTGVKNFTGLALDATAGNTTVTLGAAASEAGFGFVNAGSVLGTFTLNAGGFDTPLFITAAAGTNVITGTMGDDAIEIDGATFNSSDKINGGGVGSHDRIEVYNKETIADSAFTNVRNVEVLKLGEFNLPNANPGVVTLGTLSQAAGVTEVDSLLSAGTTLNAGARTLGVTFNGDDHGDVFFGSAGDDTFNGGTGDDSYRVKVANLTANDRIAGGAGIDEIRILDAGTLNDSAFAHVSGIERLAFDDVGKQTVTLGASAQADGLTTIDAGKVTGGLVLDSSAMTGNLKVTMGTGADSLTLGGAALAMNDIYTLSSRLTAADHISAPSQAINVLHFTDAVKLTDAYFAGVASGNVSGLDGLYLDNHGKGQSLTAGANFASFVQHNLALDVFATSNDPTTGFTFDFSAYAGKAIGVSGSVGSDTFVEGASDVTYSAEIGNSSTGSFGGDTIKFASQYLDGQHMVFGTNAALDTVLVTDAKNAIVDADFANLSSVEILKLGAATTSGYSVTFGAQGFAAGFAEIDASSAGVSVTVDITATTANPMTVIAGAKSNILTDAGGSTVFTFAPTSLDAGDHIDAGAGLDYLKFSAGGAVAATAFANVKGIEELVLSHAGNAVTLSDALVAGVNGPQVNIDGYAVDFAVLGNSGNDTEDASKLTGLHTIGLVAGAGTDRLVGASTGTNDYFFLSAGDLAVGDQVKGTGATDVVIAAAGTYTAAVFKGFTSIEDFVIDDKSHPGVGSTITLDGSAVTQAGNTGFFYVGVLGTGSDLIDASADTLAAGTANALIINPGGGNDKVIGPANGGTVAFDDNGASGFLLDQNDIVIGNGHTIIELISQVNANVTLGLSDLVGVTGVSTLELTGQAGGSHITVNYGTAAQQAGIQEIDGTNAQAGFTLNATGATHALDVLLSEDNDTIALGSADDTLTVNGFNSALLTSADHIDGGGGRDHLSFLGGTTLVDGDFANVSHVEEIDVSADPKHGTFASSITLGAMAQAAGITEVDASHALSAATVDASAMTAGITIIGSDHADIIKGGAGSDTLETGGGGGDTLTGGAGADIFEFDGSGDSRQRLDGSLGYADLITDFNALQLDAIHLDGLGVTAGSITERSAGAFTTTSVAGFFGASQVAVQYDGSGETRLYADVNHNGNYDIGIDTMIRLTGNHAHEIATNPSLIVAG